MKREARPSLEVLRNHGARPGGRTAEQRDFVLRWGLAISTAALAFGAASAGRTSPLPDAAFVAGLSAVCAIAHAIPIGPRSISLLSLAVGGWTAVAAPQASAFSTILGAVVALASLLRWVLYVTASGPWLLRRHALEQRRRRSLIGTGLALGHGALPTLAGDLYEDAGRALFSLLELGARPRAAEWWRRGATGLTRALAGLPGFGVPLRRLAAGLARRIKSADPLSG